MNKKNFLQKKDLQKHIFLTRCFFKKIITFCIVITLQIQGIIENTGLRNGRKISLTANP
jgi:hypothetical protein